MYVSRCLFVSLLSIVVTLVACNGDESAGLAPVGGADCLTVSAGAGPTELAAIDTGATPRADRNAEILALETSGEFIAPEGLYQRVNAELIGIRAQFPQLAWGVRPCHAPDGLIVHLTDEAFQQVQANSYAAWDAVNANLRVSQLTLGALNRVTLRFEGLYNMLRVAAGYAELPGITAAEPDDFAGDGADVCLAPRLKIHFYIFRNAEGDCAAGCINQSFTAVEVDTSGNIGKVGEWDGTGSEPQWFADADDCQAFL